MREYQQKLILDLLAVCRQGHDTMRHLPAGESEQLTGILEDCLQYAAQTAEFIGQVYGDGSRSAALLETYCGLLQQALVNGEIPIKELNRQLIKITGSVKSELKPDKIEMVFLPYKASMGDSLESIYLAAKEDPQCDAYWIPIPYYDKNPDDTLGKMHYEGADYPPYIEITDWETYDMEARHPDAIFIMNPYDNWNTVTSVHPDFYAERLKDLTDLLVYVNYGIAHRISKDPSSVVKAETTMATPGQIYCDLHACYSRERTEAYKLALLRWPPTKDLFTRKQVDAKIIPLGSPKFDKVLHSTRENTVLPNEWADLIGNRKVLLFNTSLADLLHDTPQFLETARAVIETVRARDDIICWWRPHPLSMDTFLSMRPQLLADYQALIGDFKNSLAGIYDDTADLHRAIAWSDGCLTNDSSVVYLYLATGKPFSIMSLKKRLKNPKAVDDGSTFAEPLKYRLANMKKAKGANIGNWNCCIWWDNFLDENIYNKVHYNHFVERFIHYIVHRKEYPAAEEYRQLQLQMFYDFVVNADGTAGQKIYECCKQKIAGAIAK